MLHELGNVIQRRMSRRQRRLPVIVANPAPRRLTGAVVQVLNLAHVLTPNRYEAATLISGEPDHVPTAVTAERLTNTYGNCEWAAVTYGAQGWSWASRGRSATSGTDSLPSMGVRDKIGASDVFTAVVALFRCSGASIDAATLTAGVAARIAVARVGGAFRSRRSKRSNMTSHHCRTDASTRPSPRCTPVDFGVRGALKHRVRFR